jgi:hypothetical protein
MTHYCWLRICYNGQEKLQRFFITSLGQDRIVLGYPFLYQFNPEINWSKGRLKGGSVQLQSPRYKYIHQNILKMQVEAKRTLGRPKDDEALYVRRTNVAQQWAQKADERTTHLTIDTIPKEYQRHAKVFSEQESKRFPPDREGNMTI